MVDLPDYNDLLWMELKNYIPKREDKRAIYEEDENCIRLLSLLCEEMKHYGRKNGEKNPSIEIQAVNKESEIKITYNGPILQNVYRTHNKFDLALSRGTEKLENGNKYKNKIHIQVD